MQKFNGSVNRRITRCAVQTLAAVGLVVGATLCGCDATSPLNINPEENAGFISASSPELEGSANEKTGSPTDPTDSTTATRPASVPPRIDHYVLKDRQKFVGLQAYIKGIEYDSFVFSVTSAPAHGQLLGVAPNLAYVPTGGYTGFDQFTYRADSGGSTFIRTIYLSVQSNYVPPVGIPAPTFGITQSHLMYANSTFDFGGSMEPYRNAGNGPYTHYVDFDTGSDVGNPFGTAAQPRKSIPEGLTPGSVVELHGTNLNVPSIHMIRGAGTAARPIFVRGPSPSRKTVLRRSVEVECDYLICENLEFDCRDGSDVWFWVTRTQMAPYRTFHHVALRHTLFHDQPTVATGDPLAVAAYLLQGVDTSSLQTENIVVYDVEVRNFSQWNDLTGTQDYGGVLFGPNTRNCWALDCHLHHIRSSGVSVCRCNGSTNMTPPDHIYVGRNYVHNVKEHMIIFKYGVDCVCSQNICHTVRVSQSSAGSAIPIINNDGTANWPGSDRIWIICNTIYDCERGIFHDMDPSLLPGGIMPVGTASRSYIVGNTFFDVRAINGSLNSFGMAVFKGRLAQSRIVNNLVTDCREGFRLGVWGMATPEACSQAVTNNIVTNLSPLDAGAHSGCEFYIPTDAITPYTTINNNLYFQGDRAVRFTVTVAGSIEMNFNTLAGLQAATTFGLASIQADPKLINPAALDFRLLTGSPAFRTGIRDTAYDLFKTNFPGMSIDYYQDGSPRPSGSAMDMGPLPVSSATQGSS